MNSEIKSNLCINITQHYVCNIKKAYPHCLYNLSQYCSTFNDKIVNFTMHAGENIHMSTTYIQNMYMFFTFHDFLFFKSTYSLLSFPIGLRVSSPNYKNNNYSL